MIVESHANLTQPSELDQKCSERSTSEGAPKVGHELNLIFAPSTNALFTNNIAMENEDFCDSLLVTEVFTPSGHWSSYPSHRHDEDDYPRITYLEETYYHRLNPSNGFGIQRVYTDDGQLDETMAVTDGDVVLVPRGHHPFRAPYGLGMYYLNVMAGPLRKWRFVPAPEVEWIMKRDG